jgi:hypothetical protein
MGDVEMGDIEGAHEGNICAEEERFIQKQKEKQNVHRKKKNTAF